jgi:hypothetical protein
LTAAALVPLVLDFLLTLLGQHPSYWHGKRWVSESNPVWAALLLIHPAVFLVGVLLYASIFTAGIYFCPKPVAWWLSIVLLLAHAGGARSWLWHFTSHVTLWEMILDGSTAALAACCFLKASRQTNESVSAAGKCKGNITD